MTDAITIPTYHRPEIGTLTLNTLIADCGVPPELIHVYVGGGDYRDAMDFHTGVHWHTAPVGYGPAHNHIRDQWPRGTRLLVLDDDVTGISRLDGKRLHPIGDNLLPTMAEAFDFIARERLTLFGVSHSDNPFYMSDRWKIGAYTIPGYGFGHINNPDIRITEPGKQDLELSILHLIQDGGIARLDNISVQTKPMRGYAGGLQHDGTRDDGEARATASLLERFPAYVSGPTRKYHEQADLSMRIRAKR